MIQQVRSDVRRLARAVGHEQFPAVYDQLDGEFALVPATAAQRQPEPAAGPRPPAPTLPSASTDPCAAARADWQLVRDMSEPEVFRAFVAQHRACLLMVALAESRIGELTRSDTPAPAPGAASRSSGGEAAPVTTGSTRIGSYWDHNGSTMGLIAEGASRTFVYVEPRAALLSRGVGSGTVLFEGRRAGNRYEGTARIFRGGACGSFSYAVAGEVGPDQRSVTMYGKAPRVDANCRVVGGVDDRLHFSLK